MVIIFMLSASVALASIVATVIALSIVVDSEHRIRVDKIDSGMFVLWRMRKRMTDGIGRWASSVWEARKAMSWKGKVRLEENGEF